MSFGESEFASVRVLLCVKIEGGRSRRALLVVVTLLARFVLRYASFGERIVFVAFSCCCSTKRNSSPKLETKILYSFSTNFCFRT